MVSATPARAPRTSSGMTPRFGPLVRLAGLSGGLERVRLEEHAAERVREAQARGPVIYLLQRFSALDHLALNAALIGSDLPLSAWAPGIRTGWVRPPGAGGFRRVRDPIASGWAARVLQEGQSLTLFGAPEEARELAAQLPDVPVQVVPVQIAWNRSPRAASPAVRFFSGQLERPSLIRRLWRLWRRADVFVQVAEAIDLRQIASRVPPERLPKILLRIATRTLYREAKLVRGPRLLPYPELKRRVLAHPPLRELARSEAAERGVPPAAVERQMRRQYDRIAARFSWLVIRMLHIVLRPLWTRVFSGVDVPAEDLERIRSAMREGTPILVPNHRSHFDYVLLSWVLFDHDMIVPHVVAGMNLAVWPLSIFLRGAGGFFIERSFAGERIFPAVFARYLRELILREYPIEFFIEGGRSRSGKLLRPKLGVLSMVLDAAAVRRRGRQVTLLPICFTYEQVAEERAYAREIRGRRKKPESLLQFFRASADVLRRRFGRVYLRVGEPVECGPVVDDPEWEDRSEADRSREVAAVGDRLVYRIGQSAVLLASSVVALALMAHHRHAIRHDDLMARIRRLTVLLVHLGARPAPDAEELVQNIPLELDRFLTAGWLKAHREASPEGGDDPVWEIEPDERVRLDYHKNQLLHLLVDLGLVACALHAHPGPLPIPAADLQADVDYLRDLWRDEFIAPPEITGAEHVARGVAGLVHHGALQVDEAGCLTAVDPVRMGEIHGLFRPLLEGYAVVLRRPLQGADAKAIARAMLAQAQARLSDRSVSRPEALSMETLKNAIRQWIRLEVLVETPGDGLRVDEASARGHLERMGAMVGR